MRSQLSDEEICSGMWASGALPSLRTVSNGAHGDVLVGGAQMHVQIEAGEGDGLAFGIGGDGFSGGRRGQAGGGAGGGGGLAVLVRRAGVDDLAVVDGAAVAAKLDVRGADAMERRIPGLTDCGKTRRLLHGPREQWPVREVPPPGRNHFRAKNNFMNQGLSGVRFGRSCLRWSAASRESALRP